MLIAICEDTVKDMENVTALCDRYAEEYGYKIKTLQYKSAEDMLKDEEARDADILLLDITMPGPDDVLVPGAGVALARKMRADGFAGPIIFTTTSRDYYPEGFEVAATHYLIKPLRYEMIAQALARAVALIKQPERTVTVPVNRIQITIAQNTILYAEVFGRETMLHTLSEDLRVLLPLKNIEAMLDPALFLRCYRSYIINMGYVISMQEEHFLLKGNIRIPITLRNRQHLKERFFAYRLAKYKE